MHPSVLIAPTESAVKLQKPTRSFICCCYHASLTYLRPTHINNIKLGADLNFNSCPLALSGDQSVCDRQFCSMWGACRPPTWDPKNNKTLGRRRLTAHVPGFVWSGPNCIYLHLERTRTRFCVQPRWYEYLLTGMDEVAEAKHVPPRTQMGLAAWRLLPWSLIRGNRRLYV